MPQASSELRQKFPGGDRQALEELAENFIWDRGIIGRKDPLYVPTDREYDCIDYMCDEWDFGYDLGMKTN